MTCPHCREDARFKGYRDKGLLSILGPLTIRRGYYHCPHCHHGHCPGDVAFGLDRSDLTAGAAELAALAGTLDNFARAAEVILPKMSGIVPAESTVQRTTEAIGAELGRAIEAKVPFDEARPWDWHKDAEGVACAYVSIDLTGVAKQGPGGVAAEGEMVAVGMVYNPVPEEQRQWADPDGPRPAWRARYVASLEGQQAVAEPLHHTAGRVGIGGARRWIAVCDGGSGLEDLLRLHFGRLDVVILDFYHASEHLGAFAKAWCPGDAEAAGTRRGRTGSSTRAAPRSWRGWRDWTSPRIRGAPGVGGGRDLLPQPGPSDGLSRLSGQGLADRLRSGGGGV